ncbi:GntR family transcriptional regulator [Wenjunlia tyrosinilytica]|uniref:Transcriptional regulator n=1 Tax=Wenjunlia tyrosinilytica TaxID=1544741 RepID=A0A917ZP81_9ACTN|nr:GntR family transcriptional regulator [Wenjunlia tyrosinilytica]GGO86696.1 transcriptional regulator [Wenjunlia tyrosinilytica]
MAKKYEQIADALRKDIRAGRLKPGDRLPAETALAEQFRTSVPTMRQALSVLQAEGLVEKVHGVANFVRKPRRLVQRSNDRHQWEKDRARGDETERRSTGATERDTGLAIDDLVFSAQYRRTEADEDLAEAFGVPQGTALLERVYRTRYREEGEPFSLVRSYLVYDVVAANADLLDETQEPWPGGTQNQLYTLGIELGEITERVTARPPTVEEAEELGITAGVAVLLLRKACRDINGSVVEVSDVTSPGDRTEMVFRTPLARW